ncbi:MAG: flippase-like domain-containing protein [Clostridiales bacterium]|nr:flippase-like domain-containing protein [Clostridiales bacterium]
MKKDKVKKTLINFIILAILLAIIFFIFKNDYKEILSCIKNISPVGLLVLLCMEIIYLLLDSTACYILLRSRFPSFRFRQALGVTFLGIFGNTAAFSAGIIPLQSYYLCKYNIEVGKTVGLMNLKYIFHKSSIFIYAAAMLLIHSFAGVKIPGLMKYIYTGFGVCAVIIAFLILICTLPAVQQALLKLIERLPKTEKWNRRKSLWSDNLKSIYTESKNVLKNPSCCLKIIFVNLIKLSWFYTIPFVCIKVLGFSSPAFIQTQVLASIMLLITGVLPNAAGIGAAEFSFMLIFSAYLEKIQVSSALILYRSVTYFFPFLLSIVVFLRINRIGKNKKDN